MLQRKSQHLVGLQGFSRLNCSRHVFADFSFCAPHYPRVHHMPDSHSNATGPSLLPIERPRCPKCHDHMSLARIMPGRRGFDLRNFECGKCDQLITVTVSTDPMKSDKAGWLAGDLRPPN
jgi:hypothetical protein